MKIDVGRHLNEIPSGFITRWQDIRMRYDSQTINDEDTMNIQAMIEVKESGAIIHLSRWSKIKTKRLGAGWGVDTLYLFTPDFINLYYAQVLSRDENASITRLYYNEENPIQEIEYHWWS